MLAKKEHMIWAYDVHFLLISFTSWSCYFNSEIYVRDCII